MKTSERSALSRALDPSTPPDNLVKLAAHRRFIVRRAVAENPNTPPDILGKLGALFPKSFAQNPAVPLLLIEDPDYLARQPLLLKRLLALRELPEFLWVEAKRHQSREIRVLLADSPHAPPSMLSTLLEDASSIVQRRALLNQKTPTEDKERKLQARNIGDAIAELSENLGYAPKNQSQLQRALRTLSWREAEVLRLCFGMPEDGKLTGDFPEESPLASPADAVVSMNLAEQTKKREEKVLRMRFGIGEKSGHTIEEVTRERIRAIDAKALRKLQQKQQSSKRLKAFIEQ